MTVFCALEIAVMAVLVGITMGHLEGKCCYPSLHGDLNSICVLGLPILSAATGCAYQGLLKLSTLIWIPGLVFEPVLFLLVAYKAWAPKENYPTIPLVRKIAQDRLVCLPVYNHALID